ncbi:hypothetical protein VQ02_08505 [Methylobacterium variabile]|jgi:hypothetical protein|uniref:DUF4054 domain-containing protein n=1 Tax=Methylobacterium variabile TaxID=298794 RepID=A0A0J6T304_9HYPH|nr:DUF4054 domain-containing protein [Methylobacterium variabile]KMO40162.1 hypothetical protein VQ02_08505 [Methylobacterium variabile]
MADALTPEAFRARFPAFAAVPDDALAGALAEAASRVGAAWAPADARLGRMLYAAHTLTLDGLGGPEAELARAGALDLKGFRSGTLHLERRDAPAEALPGTLGLTSYGLRFHEVMRRNSIGVAVM